MGDSQGGGIQVGRSDYIAQEGALGLPETMHASKICHAYPSRTVEADHYRVASIPIGFASNWSPRHAKSDAIRLDRWPSYVKAHECLKVTAYNSEINIARHPARYAWEMLYGKELPNINL